MRFKSQKTGGYQVFAVSGTNTISFGIDFDGADTRRPPRVCRRAQRSRRKASTSSCIGFKVFPSVIPQSDKKTAVKHVRSSDPELRLGRLHRQAGSRLRIHLSSAEGRRRKNLDRSAAPISIKVRTEPLFSKLEHDVFFNRGVASSQAYAREFEQQEARRARRRPIRSSEGGAGVAEPQPRRGHLEVHRPTPRRTTRCCAASTSFATARSPMR